MTRASEGHGEETECRERISLAGEVREASPGSEFKRRPDGGRRSATGGRDSALANVFQKRQEDHRASLAGFRARTGCGVALRAAGSHG